MRLEALERRIFFKQLIHLAFPGYIRQSQSIDSDFPVFLNQKKSFRIVFREFTQEQAVCF